MSAADEWIAIAFPIADLLCLAKGITGGYLPLAATLATERIYEGFLGEVEGLRTFFHGHTYTANPLCCAAANARELADAVTEAGGRVYVAGERMTKPLFDRQEAPSNSWLSMLPVVVEPGLYQSEVQMKLSAQNAWKLEITPEGKADPVSCVKRRENEYRG